MMKLKLIKDGILLVFGMASICLSSQALARTLIKDTRHNLSNWSPYASSVSGDTNQVCIFCHAPHNADSAEVPLWNRNDPDTASPKFSMASTVNVNWNRPYADDRPTGTSKKCLSCHDGTLAIGEIRNGAPITMSGSNIDLASGKLSGSAPGNIGTNLRGGHVISFKYKDAIDYFDPPRNRFNDLAASDRNSMLDRQGKMQCHTCHDPHNDWCNDPGKYVGRDPLWRKACDAENNGVVCRTCHKAALYEYTAPNIGF